MTAPARTPWRPAPPAAARVAVKICGVTDPESALLSAELGAGFLGLNFWPGSPRCLDLPRAREIAAAVRAAAPRVALVGVFVNPAAAAVREAADAVGLDLLQFSGDETPDDVRPFAARAIKALRLVPEGDAAAAVAAFAGCWGLLFDAPAPAPAPAPSPSLSDSAGASGPVYGGTGRAWDYAAAAAAISTPARIFLAGGLRPANVRRVVAALRPFAVDVCSGVESAPGRKDPRLLRQLFEEVRNGQAPVAT